MQFQFQQTTDEISNNLMVDKEKISNTYYQNNREQIIKYKCQKSKCTVCNIEYTVGNKTNHFRSKRHEMNELKLKLNSFEKKLANIPTLP